MLDANHVKQVVASLLLPKCQQVAQEVQQKLADAAPKRTGKLAAGIKGTATNTGQEIVMSWTSQQPYWVWVNKGSVHNTPTHFADNRYYDLEKTMPQKLKGV